MSQHYLNEAERSVLRDVIAAHPGWSHGQVSLEFEARAGRPISHTTVAVARRDGVRDRPRRKVFTPAEWASLDLIIRAEGPEPDRGQVASTFALTTGRTISRDTVSRRIRLFHKLPALPPGPRRDGLPRGLGLEKAKAEVRASRTLARSAREDATRDQG